MALCWLLIQSGLTLRRRARDFVHYRLTGYINSQLSVTTHSGKHGILRERGHDSPLSLQMHRSARWTTTTGKPEWKARKDSCRSTTP